MTDTMTRAQRHYTMSHIHSVSTKPEMKLRQALWHLGFRYRINVKLLPGSPDIALTKYHTVIFVHGCFWHGHKNCKHYTVPKSNSEFWIAKVRRNQERDQKVWRQLEAQGWNVIIVWECQLKHSILHETVTKVSEELCRNEERYRSLSINRKIANDAYRKERRNRKIYLSDLNNNHLAICNEKNIKH